MTVLREKQFAMRVRRSRLTDDEKYAIGRGWPKTLLALLKLQGIQMRRDLEKSEVKQMRGLERLVRLRERVYGLTA